MRQMQYKLFQIDRRRRPMARPYALAWGPQMANRRGIAEPDPDRAGAKRGTQRQKACKNPVLTGLCCPGCPDKFLVPTARLELAQLSPLPPQDSVSTNFTTSAYFIQKSRGFLESRTFYHVIDDSRASTRLVAPGPAARRASPGNKPLQARQAMASNLSCRRAILASPCAHPGCSRGISSGYSYKREFVGAHAWPAYDASHTQQGLRPVEKVPPCNV